MNQLRSGISKYFFSRIDLNKFKIPQNVPVETSYLTDIDVNTLDRIKDYVVINNDNRMIILIILLRIEDKIENDITFTNKDWSEIFEVSLFIFNYYEYKMLELFNFNINFKLEEYIKYKKKIDYLLNY